MNAGLPVIAIFDIGKIDKRFLLFDKNYSLVEEKHIQFEEMLDEDGEPCENLPALTSWIKQTLDDTLFNHRFRIQALNFSAYGAGLVHLDKRGMAIIPLYSYLKSYPEQLLNQFYHQHGDQEIIALQTASPPLGMMNSGLQLYWVKHHKPELYKKIKYSLHLPQYCSYLITNRPSSELTSIGCHTAIWDFRNKAYHAWVYKEDLSKHFPPIAPADSKLNIPLGKYKFYAGNGIHDSSAALIPYLKMVKEPFILLSTGTWNITFNSFNEEPLTSSELAKDSLAYMNIEGKPVKASRLFLGNEHTFFEKKIATYFSKDSQHHKGIKFDKKLVQKLLHENNSRKKFTPATVEVGLNKPFTKRKPVNLSLFSSYEEAYHQLNIDLVAMQAMSIEAVMGQTLVKKICVSGIFCENEIFIHLLASRFPDFEVNTPSMSKASALGAALVMHKHWNEKEVQHLFDLQVCTPHKDIAMMEYAL